MKVCLAFSSICSLPRHPLIDIGWTKEHGFFAVMGGFTDDQGRVLSPYYSDHFRDNLGSKTIDITKEEIRDRSKMDWVLRTVNILQILWFMSNFLNRLVSPILYATEVEILTFTFTILSFAMYCFWWWKPRSVDCPLRTRASPLVPDPLDQPVPDPRLSTLCWNTFFCNLASSILCPKNEDEQYTGSNAKFISKSVLDTYNGDLSWNDMSLAVLSASVFGLGSGAFNVVAGVIGYGPGRFKGLLWITSASAGCIFPLYMPFAILYSLLSKGELKRNERLGRALRGNLCRKLLAFSVVGRLTLIGSLGVFMLEPYYYKAFITAPIIPYLPHLF